MKRLFVLLLTAVFLLASCTAPKHEEHKSSVVSSGVPEPSAPIIRTELSERAETLLEVAASSWDDQGISGIYGRSEADIYDVIWCFSHSVRANIYTEKGKTFPSAVIFVFDDPGTGRVSGDALAPFKTILKKLGLPEASVWDGSDTITVDKVFKGDGFSYMLKKREGKYFLCLYASDFLFALDEMPIVVSSEQLSMLDSAEKLKELRTLVDAYDFKGVLTLIDAYEKENVIPDDAHIRNLQKIAESASPLQDKCSRVYDDIEEETRVFYKGIESISKKVHVVPYAYKSSVYTDVGFVASDWLFFDDWTIKAGETKISGYVGDFGDYREVLRGGRGVTEVAQRESIDYKEICAIHDTGAAKLRFENTDDHKTRDYDLSAAEIEALYTVYTLNKAYKESSDFLSPYEKAFG